MDNPLQALAAVTGPMGKDISGIGKGLHHSIRQWLGLEDVYELAVVAREEKVSDDQEENE